MKKSVFVILFILPVLLKAQTCIIATRTRDSLFVGTDTKIGVIATGATYNGCKIDKDGKRYLAVAGFGINIIRKITLQAFSTQKTLLLSTKYVKKNTKQPLLSYLEDLKQNHNDQYEKNKPGFENVQILLFGFEAGLPRILSVYFHFVEDGYKFRTTLDTIYEYMNGPLRFVNESISLGHNELVEPFLSDHTAAWAINGYEQGIYELIGKQCNSTPQFVGRPVMVLILTKSGYRWYGDNVLCF